MILAKRDYNVVQLFDVGVGKRPVAFDSFHSRTNCRTNADGLSHDFSYILRGMIFLHTFANTGCHYDA